MSDDLEGFTRFGEHRSSRERKAGNRRAKQQKRPHYGSLPRSVRRQAAVSLGWRIQTNPDGAGVFDSHQLLPRTMSARSAGMPEDAISHWADFKFLSTKPIREGLLYNAMAHTVASVVVGKMEDLAQEAVDALLTPDEKEQDRVKMWFGPRDKDGCRESRFSKHPTLAALGGATSFGYKADWLLRHSESLELVTALCPTRPRARLDHEYAYGIGLDILTVEHSIDGESIPRIIAEFRRRGEQAYEDEPIDLAPHWFAIRAMLIGSAAIMARMDANTLDQPMPEWPSAEELGGEEALRHLGWESVGVKM
jgi:hypothetical protein